MLDRTKLPLERTEPCQIPIPLLTTYAGNAIRTYFNRVLWVQPQDATVVCQQEVGAGGVRVLRVYECGAVPKDCALVLPTHYVYCPDPRFALRHNLYSHKISVFGSIIMRFRAKKRS